ncbi:hypothetical protein F4819DRAFT_185157 [Hypoxylon fuscum]|nr:hypothetical protein F4819DRAFT_185157 [Hypoxylon fuscum]
MQPVCVPDIAMRAVVHGCRRGGNGLSWAERGCRRYATSSSKRTPPPPKNQKATPKPLPFKPPQQKPTPKSKPSFSSPTSSPSSSSSQGYEDKKQPVSDMVRGRWFPLFGAGAAAVCFGLFTASGVIYWRREPAEHWMPGQEPEAPTGRPSIQSPMEFDQHLDKSEWRYGITKLRRRIGSEMARGHVLEVAIGTGRNFDYYDWSVVTQGFETAEKVEKSSWFSWTGGGERGKEKNEKGQGNLEGKETEKKEVGKEAKPTPPVRPKAKAPPKKPNENAVLSFTGLDISPPMLDLALTRIRQVVPHMADQIPKKPSFSQLASTAGGGDSVSLANNRIRILQGDAQQAPLPASPSPSSQKYDTIIQTFGLCSVRDPVLLLSNMASSLQPETGRIVLLEHGRSWWELVNGMLDRSARQHFERFGCWWNRDIELVVRAAENAVPGLEVLRLERPGWITMGTHVLVEMRVRDVPQAAAVDNGKEKGSEGAQKSTATSWWSSLLSVDEKPKKD